MTQEYHTDDNDNINWSTGINISKTDVPLVNELPESKEELDASYAAVLQAVYRNS